MMRAALLWLLVLALLGGAGACNAGEVVVFAPSAGGSAGGHLGGVGGVGGVGGAGAANFGGSPAAGSGGDAVGGGGSGGSGGSVDKACQTTNDCDPTWYCQKQNCSDPGGLCLPRPNTDNPMRLPVCGCEDNITYWNDTLRQQRGISASFPGECKFGVIGCTSDEACGTDSSADASMRCSRNLPSVNACGSPGSGQCWVVPSDCTDTSDRERFLPCPPPPGSPTPACMTACQAMNSGVPYLDKPQNFDCK
jgi:hypothetical protein